MLWSTTKKVGTNQDLTKDKRKIKVESSVWLPRGTICGQLPVLSVVPNCVSKTFQEHGMATSTSSLIKKATVVDHTYDHSLLEEAHPGPRFFRKHPIIPISTLTGGLD